MVLKDKRTTSTDLQEKYSAIEKSTDTVLWLKTEIKRLATQKNKSEAETNNLERMKQALKNQENQLEEKKDNLSRRQKNKIIREQYRTLFQSDLSKFDQYKDSISMVFNPALLLKNQFETLESLKESITLNTDNQNQQNTADFFELLKKVNQFLIVLRNLEVNVPEPTKSPLLRVQRGMIKTPVYGAEFFARLFTRGKKEINNRFRNIDNSLEEYIAFQAFESSRDSLLSVPSFFPKRNEEESQEDNSKPDKIRAQFFITQLQSFETRLSTTETRELPKLYSEILRTPFTIVEALGHDLEDPENHPKKLYYDLIHGKRGGLTTNPLFIEALEEAINKHEIVASLLNMEFSYWRRYSLLNLETIKSTINRMPADVLRAITFDETQIIPSFLDLDKMPNSQNLPEDQKNATIVKFLNDNFESAISRTFAYDAHEWQVKDNTLGKLLIEQGVHTAFTSYNRNLTNSRTKEVNATIPRSAYAVLTPSKEANKQFDVELKIYGSHTEDRYNDYHSKMLEFWIESKGDITETKHAWKKQLQSYSEEEKTAIPSFDELLSRVYTLPCILLISEISTAKNVNQLQQELTQKTNELRSNFVTAAMLISFQVDENGDFAVSSSCDHSNWDGKQSGDFIEKVLSKIITQTNELHKNQEAELQNSTSHVDVNATTSSVPETQKDQFESEGNHQIQSYVEAEGFVRICDEIGKMVKKLIAEHKISPDSKLKNPAVIMQLLMINEYKKILIKKKIFSPNQSIGMLLGNPDITKDLDLAPIQNGFDFEFFKKLTKEQQDEYLISQALLFEIALTNTSMKIIEKVVNSIPNKRIQNTLNAISRSWPLRRGLTDLSNEYMISNFGLPRIINGEIIIPQLNGFQVVRASGPAQADVQTGSLTATGALKMTGKFFLSICYKNNSNAIAVKIAQDFKKFIEQYDQQYYDNWMTEQTTKGE